MIFKCKMCGGELNYAEGATVCECEFCGTKQTLPKLDDDHRANLYDRANHFRRNNDYDKAMGIYEKILEEDRTDAEAYWSIVLCRYGIEYVEDPGTHKRVPTVNRAQYTSILADEDYKSALQYADAAQQEIYRSEAEYIDRVQKGILEISQKEKPFDVFLCYKETDEQGRRTRDSVTANEIYHELTREGLKVFFARITLEDKIGEAYEPYIFAALNSAKVMVVLGSKAEYFNAVWVRNEWSRFLVLIRAGQRKTLIPAYKDMDPYDLPEEFSHLQALDMNKLGFMPDLIRGIKKIVGAEQKQEASKEASVASKTEQSIQNTTGSVHSLLKRVFMFLEDGDWKSANDYCERVLDMDPENAQAYLGKMLSEMKLRRPEDLCNQEKSFENNANFKKILRFGNENEKAQVQGYVRFIRDRNENNRKQGILDDALKIIRSASSTDACERASAQLGTIKGFEGVKEALAECDAKRESLLKERYDCAIQMQKDGQFVNARLAFEALGDFRDSRKKAEKCTESILNKEYETAKNLQNEKRWAESIVAFNALGDYRDSKQRAEQCFEEIHSKEYKDAVNLQEQRQWDKAIAAFSALGDYRDSRDRIKTCQEVKEAEKKEKEERERQAALIAEQEEAETNKYAIIVFALIVLGVLIAIFVSKTIIPNLKYDKAKTLLKQEEYREAYTLLDELRGYKDVDNLMTSNPGLVRLSLAMNGSIFRFGNYEQDETKNGKESIEWIVLDTDGTKSLLISKYGLDAKAYNNKRTNTTWENCTLRTWLNDVFVQEAFSDEEQKAILTTSVDNSDIQGNSRYNTNGGSNTQDQVFLLSYAEAWKYFELDNDRICTATMYANSQGAYDNNGKSGWWLRSPGSEPDRAAYVSSGGACDYDYVHYNTYAIRPAFWLDLNSLTL